jgi:Domain of unknown function (DUF4252)
MRSHLHRFLAATLVGTAAVTTLFAADQPAGYVDFGKFTPSTAGGEFVEVKLSSGLIQMAAKIARKHEPDVADLLKNVRSVRVNVVPLGDDNLGETERKAETIRAELEGKGWEQIVNVKEKNQDVAIFLKTRNAETVEGIVITVVEDGKQAVFVNVVGDVKLDQLSKLGDKLNLEPLKKVGEVIEKEAGTKEGEKK